METSTRRVPRPRWPKPASAETDGLLARAKAESAACMLCSLSLNRTNCVFGYGHGNADLMWVGEAAGPEEDAAGEPFIGRSGDLLTRIIEGIGLNRNNVFLANTVSCRLNDQRRLTRDQTEACRPQLEKQIELVNPKVIIALGSTAWTWFKHGDKRKMAEVRGQVHRWRKRLIVPTYHPAFLLRKEQYKADVWRDVCTAVALLQSGDSATSQVIDIEERPDPKTAESEQQALAF